MSNTVEVRSVYASNFVKEREKIEDIPFKIVGMDCEYPGTVYRTSEFRDPATYYACLKANVDLLKVIQIGLTVADLGDGACGSWEFNLSDFDVTKDPYVLDSVKLLESQGINLETNKNVGISIAEFGEWMMSSGLVLNDQVSWVFFQGGYDLGFLVKCMTGGRPLPEDLHAFLKLVRMFFPGNFYDVKQLMEDCGIRYGGLTDICLSLGIERVAGKSHQAGSDSLLTLHAYRGMKERYFGEGRLEPLPVEFFANRVCLLQT